MALARSRSFAPSNIPLAFTTTGVASCSQVEAAKRAMERVDTDDERELRKVVVGRRTVEDEDEDEDDEQEALVEVVLTFDRLVILLWLVLPYSVVVDALMFRVLDELLILVRVEVIIQRVDCSQVVRTSRIVRVVSRTLGTKISRVSICCFTRAITGL
jgi:hypothetical protein